MCKVRPALAVVAVFGLMFGSAMADDINPPIWRGAVDSSFSACAFATSTNPSNPDVYTNTWGGIDLPEVTAVPPDGDEWRDEQDGRFGVWPLSGTMEIGLPNFPEFRPYKYVWIQITWAPADVGAPRPQVTETETAGGPHAALLVAEEAREGPWVTSTYAVRLEPNPEHETILIAGDIFVDQVVVDTLCTEDEYPILAIPTVSEWGLVALSLLVLSLGTVIITRRRCAAA